MGFPRSVSDPAAYARRALEAECETVASTAQGRNPQLNRSAFAVGQLVGTGLIGRSEAEQCLFDAAQACGYVAKDGDIQARTTIASGLEKGMREPRDGLSDRRPTATNMNNKLAPRLHDVPLPDWTEPGPDGRPKFFSIGRDEPAVHDDDLRRHVYRRDGQVVRVKVKKQSGAPGWVDNYRVRRPSDGVLGWQARKPVDHLPAAYIGPVGTADPFAVPAGGTVVLYWPEGEKDVDSIVRAGGRAFTFGGSSDVPDCGELLHGFLVAIVADNDMPGEKCALRKIEIVEAAGIEPRVVRFADMPLGADASNFLEEGHTLQDMLARSVAAKPKGDRVQGSGRELPPGDHVLVVEDAAALRFAKLHAGRLRFCHDHGAWFEWDGSIWRKNTTGLAFHWARELARDIAQNESAKVKTAAGKAGFASSVERFARSDPSFAVTADTWDRDPFLLGTPAGTVDLRTGALRPSIQSDGITRSVSVAPTDRADCPRWLRFLEETLGGDAGMIRFMQQWAGYALTGDTREHALVFVFGDGGNGKSVFIRVLMGVLAAYAAVASMDTFIASHGDRHSTDLAMLRGARLVTASETEEGRQWAESRIKQMTGGDPISARFMRQDFFTFQPTFKLTIIGNHKPGLKSIDAAARRRFNLVPFTRTPAKVDPELVDKLTAEWPGILRWMIEGCLDWQANGLVRPESIADATNSYFDEQDLMSEWMAEKCIVDRHNDARKSTTQELFGSWSSFAKANNELSGTVRGFSQTLQKLGFEPVKNVPQIGGGRSRGFAGIEVRADRSGASHG